MALVHAPVSSWYGAVYEAEMKTSYRQALEELAREADIPLFLVSKTRLGLEDADYFVADGRFDGHHILSTTGREAFRHFLESKVAIPILNDLEAGRSVSFDQSVIDEEVP